MSSTTLARGNILSANLVQIYLAAKTIADPTDEISVSVPGVIVGNVVFPSTSFLNTSGVYLVNARVTAANTVALQFVNVTGSSAVTIAGNYYLNIIQAENPLPANIV